jgi:anti-sigma B factor antagonist
MITPSPLSVQVHYDDPRATVARAAGEIEQASVELLRGHLLPAARGGAVILDAAGISFCDFAGLRALLEAHRAARSHGNAFCLAAPSPALTRLCEITGADMVLEYHHDLETALKALSGPGLRERPRSA